jgi:predicted transposase YbfD/YdcC
LRFLDGAEDWKALRSIAKIETVVHCKKTGKKSESVRYYISSLPPDPERIARTARAHWAIENNLHWSLDVVFNEDKQAKKVGHSAHNFNIISKIALSMLENEKSVKNSKPNKRHKAALSDSYREKVLKV